MHRRNVLSGSSGNVTREHLSRHGRRHGSMYGRGRGIFWALSNTTPLSTFIMIVERIGGDTFCRPDIERKRSEREGERERTVVFLSNPHLSRYRKQPHAPDSICNDAYRSSVALTRPGFHVTSAMAAIDGAREGFSRRIRVGLAPKWQSLASLWRPIRFLNL